MTPTQEAALKTALAALEAFPAFVVVADLGEERVPAVNLNGKADRLVWLQTFALGETVYHGWRNPALAQGEAQAAHLKALASKIAATLAGGIVDVAIDVARDKIPAGNDRAAGPR